MNNIVNGKNDNFGSIAELFFVPLPTVLVFPSPTVISPYPGLIQLSNIQLDTGMKFNRFTFSRQTAEYSEDAAIKEGNIYYKQKVECFIAKDDYFKWQSFSEMEYYNFLVIFKDTNGLPKIIGGINKDGEKVGPTLTVGLATNKKWENLNGHQATFYLEAKNKARILGGFNGIYARTWVDTVYTEIIIDDYEPPIG